MKHSDPWGSRRPTCCRRTEHDRRGRVVASAVRVMEERPEGPITARRGGRRSPPARRAAPARLPARALAGSARVPDHFSARKPQHARIDQLRLRASRRAKRRARSTVSRREWRVRWIPWSRRMRSCSPARRARARADLRKVGGRPVRLALRQSASTRVMRPRSVSSRARSSIHPARMPGPRLSGVAVAAQRWSGSLSPVGVEVGAEG